MTAPRDLAEALERLDKLRQYAKACRKDADDIRKYGNPYAALPYDNTAAALERIIGGEA